MTTESSPRSETSSEKPGTILDGAARLERGWMQGATERAGRLAGIFLLSSLAAACGDRPRQAQSHEAPRQPVAEAPAPVQIQPETPAPVVRHQEEREEFPGIKTAEDAEWMVRSDYTALLHEFYFPPAGTRFSPEDLASIKGRAQTMKELMTRLHQRYGIEAYDKRVEQLDDLITAVEAKGSYSRQKQTEALERFEQDLASGKYNGTNIR